MPRLKTGGASLFELLKIFLDLLDHSRILFFRECYFAGIHGKHTTPFIFIPVLGHEMHMEMAAGNTVGAVIQLFRMKCRVNCLGCAVDILDECRPFFGSQVGDFAHMIPIGHNAAPGMALLPEQDQAADLQLTDRNAISIQLFSAHTVSAFLPRAEGLSFFQCH